MNEPWELQEEKSFILISKNDMTDVLSRVSCRSCIAQNKVLSAAILTNYMRVAN